MLIVKENLKINPFIDIINHEYLIDDLLDGIYEYVSDNLHKAVIKGQLEKVFYIGGMANHHHKGLANYLNSKILERHKLTSQISQGEFAGYPTEHTWLKINNMIVDLTISQFKDKQIDTYNKFRELLDSHCFICDNPSNIIYRLYKQDA